MKPINKVIIISMLGIIATGCSSVKTNESASDKAVASEDAAAPSYTCKSEQGCIEVQGSTYDIGRGAKISLPAGWRFFSYPTAPDPVMAGLREIRAFKDGMVIAITPFPNIDQRIIPEAFLCNLVTKSAGQYVNLSKERTINTVSMSHGDVVGCHASFTAAVEGEKPFNVLPNRQHSSITTFIISYKYIIFSVSVASENKPDEAYLEALNAIKKIQ